MEVEEALIFLLRAAFALGRDVLLHEAVRGFTKRLLRALRPPVLHRIRAGFDLAKKHLRLRPRLIRRQPPMLADRNAARTAMLAVLRDINLLARREGADAEARKLIVP
ncbi:hypothetical protein M2323_004046 [Rhodoblastus acidophilus]|nr:hypothetical protein [Rhodoblastus acidophilus]